MGSGEKRYITDVYRGYIHQCVDMVNPGTNDTGHRSNDNQLDWRMYTPGGLGPPSPPRRISTSHMLPNNAEGNSSVRMNVSRSLGKYLYWISLGRSYVREFVTIMMIPANNMKSKKLPIIYVIK